MDEALIEAAVKAVEKLVGDSASCPFCGNADWYLLDTERFLRVWAPSELTDAEIEAATTAEDFPFQTIRALGLACSTCHFIRLHNFSDEFGEPAKETP